MEIQNILTLIQAFTDHSLTELHVEDSGVKVCLKREPGASVCKRESTAISPVDTSSHIVNTETTAVPVPAEVPSLQTEISSDKVVVSPLVGIFYSASSPEAESFVKVGDRVKKGQVMGIIEAMKLMNEIESEFDGVVEAILVNNEDVVEYGQPLFRIR